MTDSSKKPKKQANTSGGGFRRGFLLAAPRKQRSQVKTSPKKKKVVLSSSYLLDLEQDKPNRNAPFLMVDNDVVAASSNDGGASSAGSNHVQPPLFQILDVSANDNDTEEGIGLSEVSTKPRRLLIEELSDQETAAPFKPVTISNSPVTSENPDSLEQPDRLTSSSLIQELDTVTPLIVETVSAEQASLDVTAVITTDFDTLNQELARVLWRLGKVKNRPNHVNQWRSIAQEFATSNVLATERQWVVVWESLLDSISQSSRAKTAELRLSAVLAEHDWDLLISFLRPTDKLSRLRAMGALSVVDYSIDMGVDEKSLPRLLDSVPVIVAIALGAARANRSVLAQRSVETVLEVIATVCNAVYQRSVTTVKSLTRSLWIQAPVVNQLWTLQTTWIEQSQLHKKTPSSDLLIVTDELRIECRLVVLDDWRRLFAQCQELSNRLTRDVSIINDTRDAQVGEIWSNHLRGSSSDESTSPIGGLWQTVGRVDHVRWTVDEIVAQLERVLLYEQLHNGRAEDSIGIDSKLGGIARCILRGVAAWLGQRNTDPHLFRQRLGPAAGISVQALRSKAPDCDALAAVIL